MELMTERFAKLLLGEDMSGGEGVSSALAGVGFVECHYKSCRAVETRAGVFGEAKEVEKRSRLASICHRSHCRNRPFTKKRNECNQYGDSLTQEPPPVKTLTPKEDQTPAKTPTSMTLSDFISWSLDSGETGMYKSSSVGNLEAFLEDSKENHLLFRPRSFPFCILTYLLPGLLLAHLF